jgi:pimeloyl-ACP methyl ester carboxylesterase
MSSRTGLPASWGRQGSLVAPLVAAFSIAAVVGLLPPSSSATRANGAAVARATAVQVRKIQYTANDGRSHAAYVALPAWYGPGMNPPIPLVISPHGRGNPARRNLASWGDLPAVGTFAVVSPEGQGRRLTRYSWGYTGQIRDLSRMPYYVTRALRWLRIDRDRIYAVGGSMGGQESLLLAARQPRLLAGVAAFDSVTDLPLQYRNFMRVQCDGRCTQGLHRPVGRALQRLARTEIGGSPRRVPRAYAIRSPLWHAREIASASVALELWWSKNDEIVVDQERQSGALLRRLAQLNPNVEVEAFVGSWRHTGAMKATRLLPLALAELGLLPQQFEGTPVGVSVTRSPTWHAG